eukprot:TRINITY_DN1316_c0_g1_i3.p1 TRINITY_DN1316_c0_g1~~TRINITY_DN1316_c0_g1_i3.p1  ORF type:complete len:124 (+),score=35.04 TRINITY_DN1316_c0_g1_i3:508-879(+)
MTQFVALHEIISDFIHKYSNLMEALEMMEDGIVGHVDVDHHIAYGIEGIVELKNLIASIITKNVLVLVRMRDGPWWSSSAFWWEEFAENEGDFLLHMNVRVRRCQEWMQRARRCQMIVQKSEN